MIQLTIAEALAQGYTKAMTAKGEFEAVVDIEDMDHTDFDRPMVVCEKGSYHPEITKEGLRDTLSEDIQQYWSDQTGDDTDDISQVIENLDFSALEKQINDALQSVTYYKRTAISLVP